MKPISYHVICSQIPSPSHRAHNHIAKLGCKNEQEIKGFDSGSPMRFVIDKYHAHLLISRRIQADFTAKEDGTMIPATTLGTDLQHNDWLIRLI
jgi:hypothetical protein